MAQPGQSYTINGVKVQFPCKAYPSQLSMMDKILKGLDRRQNCLIESPTGSGKSLALLCSALAWQAAEYEKACEEEKQLNDCMCSCHSELDETTSDPRVIPPTTCDPRPPVVKPLHPPTSSVDQAPRRDAKIPHTELSTATEQDCEIDDDFKVSKKKFRPSLDGQTPRHLEIQLDEAGNDSPKWKMMIENDKQKSNAANCCGCDCESASKSRRKIPKIYFGTRTHKQIAQIIRELRKTKYGNVRMTILSSREHTCIHPELARCSSKNEECKSLLDGPGCRYFDKAKRVFTHSCMESNGFTKSWDIEDLVRYAKKQKGCPYFGARYLRETASIIFCPYNYLVDPSIRQSMDINLSGNVVILDEAHNIEDSSREAASFTVSSESLSDAVDDLINMTRQNCKPKEHLLLKKMCEDVSTLIEQNKRFLDNLENGSKVWTGMEMVAQLDIIGLGVERLKHLETTYNSIQEKTAEEQARADRSPKIKSATAAVLEGLFMVLGFMYKENYKYVDDYRVAATKTMTYGHAPAATNNSWLSKRGRGKKVAMWNNQMNFWCMNPAVAFVEMSRGVQSVILTSGTLSPMTSFQSELGLPFGIQLEANHVIRNSQVWIASLSRGPNHSQLLGNYQTSETWAYQDDIGQIVLEICQTVPFGVLCFLPSYKSISKLTLRWETTGLMSKLKEYKAVMIEPRSAEKEIFDDIMKQFYQVIQETSAKDLDSNEPGVTGALFLAVCRGKVSEGMDFADNNARAVLTVGIPYPNIKDTQVELKKRYNDQRTSKGLLSGNDWYEIQAFRALNQALGRCIRHRNDWGALILLDERFGKNPQKYTSSLSKWVRQKMQYYGDFRMARNMLKQFCDEQVHNQNRADDSSFISSQRLADTSICITAPQHDVCFTAPQLDDIRANESANELGAHLILPNRCADVSAMDPPCMTSTPVAGRSKSSARAESTNAVFLNPRSLWLLNQPQAIPSTGHVPLMSLITAQVIGNSANRLYPDLTLLDSTTSATVSSIPTLSVGNSVKGLYPDLTSLMPSSETPTYLRLSQAGGFIPSSQIEIPKEKLPLQTMNFANASAGKCVQKSQDVTQKLLQFRHGSSKICDQNVVGYASIPKQEKSELHGLKLEDDIQFKPSLSSTQINLDRTYEENIRINEDVRITKTFEDVVKENENINEDLEQIAGNHSRSSPDLFDTEQSDINSEKFNAVVDELNINDSKVAITGDELFLKSRSGINFFDDGKRNKGLESDVPGVQSRNSIVKVENMTALQEDVLEQNQTSKNQTLKSENSLRTENLVVDIKPDCDSNIPQVNEVDGVRRSSRMKRKNSFQEIVTDSRRGKHRRSKNADILDEIEMEEDSRNGSSGMTCRQCGFDLTSSSTLTDFKTVNQTSEFWSEALHIFAESCTLPKNSLPKNSNPAVTVDKKHLLPSAFVGQEDDTSSMLSRCLWSEADSCCVQPIFCRSCRNNKINVFLGVEVKSIKNSSPSGYVGQVWLMPDCLKRS